MAELDLGRVLRHHVKILAAVGNTLFGLLNLILPSRYLQHVLISLQIQVSLVVIVRVRVVLAGIPV